MQIVPHSFRRIRHEEFVLTRHLQERCLQRQIPVEEVLRVVAAPFATQQSPEPGKRWHYGRTLTGPGRRWAWLKVVESDDAEGRALLTTYLLGAVPRSHRRSRSRPRGTRRAR